MEEASSFDVQTAKVIIKQMKNEEDYLGKIESNNFIIERSYITSAFDQYIKLYYTKIKYRISDIQPFAKLCIVHGFGHHSFDFIEFSLYLAQKGIHCYLIDLRGHGLSGGERFEWSIEKLHTDIITLIKESEKDNIDLPLFILGHSLGGGLVSSLFINNPYLQVHGVILSAPLLSAPLTVESDPVKNFIIRNYGGSLKEFLINPGINPSALTKIDSEIPKIILDKRNVPICTPNTFRSIMKMYTRILENCRNFSLPCVILHGDQDRLIGINNSRVFVDNIKSKVKDLVIFENGYHELYKDTNKMLYFEKAYQFIMKNKNSGKTDKRKNI